MVCTRPVTGYRSPLGGIVFNKAHGFADKPVLIPCGQCLSCRLERARQWSVRITDEAKMHEENSFITLTYSDDRMPEGQTLVKRHHQEFMKRLRKSIEPKRIRYFHVGEYGKQTFRPHYHTILFGHEFGDRRYLRTSGSGFPLYTSKTLDDLWGFGFTWIGTVSTGSAGYVGRYCVKKLTGSRAAEYEGREPEYSTCSRSPPIGGRYYEEFGGPIARSDFHVVDGRRARIPRAYDVLQERIEPPVEGGWGFTDLERRKRARVAAAAKRADNQTRERLDVIEELTELRAQRLRREFEE